MTIVTGSWLIDIWIFILSLVAGVYLFYQYQFQHWKKHGVPHPDPTFPFGNIKGTGFDKSPGCAAKKIHDEQKNRRFFGTWTFFRPILMIRDPELIKNVFVKDFMTFHDRGLYVNEKDDPLSAHLLSIGGVKWRNLRAKLSPTFTSGKMKMMFPTLVESSVELKSVLAGPARRKEVVEIKEIVARFTTDIISSCAFGIQTNSLKNPDAIFRKMGRKIFEPTLVNSLKALILIFMPPVAEAIKLKTTQNDVEKFFMGAVKETIDHREKHNIERKDFMQLLIQLKNKGRVDDVDDVSTDDQNETTQKTHTKFTFEEAAAQAFVFFGAGFETSSTTMQFALYELALNPDIQEKIREEINKVLAKHNGEMTYEAVFDMEYLGRVIDETLRKYPPVPVLLRECNQDYLIPDTDITIPSGTQIHISILGIQNDPEHYPVPERFDPDRFTEEEKSKRHHYAYLPFGEGPRNCIGMRFGLMQTRVGLITLLKNYRFEIASETLIPMKFDPKSFFLSPIGGMNLKISEVNQ